MDTEAFWIQIGEYNEATIIFQVILFVAGAVLTCLTFTRPGRKMDVWMKAFFALAFAWNSVVFFFMFSTNPIGRYFGAPLFSILTLIFIADIFTKKTSFQFPEAKWKKGATIFWLLLVVLYPVFGLPLGHTYPKMLTPVMPCPLTVFAIAMVTAASPKVDRALFILLLPWALAGLPKCLGALDCYEDCILFLAGVYGLILLIKDWKAIAAVPKPG